MPTKVGQADLELGVYVLRHQVQAMMFLGSLSRKVTTASIWNDLVAID